MVTQASLNRIRIFYGAYFAAMGLVLPFFPIYLDGRGFDAVMIGFMTGLLALAKVVAPPWIGQLLDRRGEGKSTGFIIIASWLAALAALLIAYIYNLYILSGMILLFGIFWAAVLPLTDGLSVAVSESDRADYGSLRVWGSIGFVVTSLAGGLWLAGENIATFPYLLAGLMVVLALAARGFPEVDQCEQQDSDHTTPFTRSFYLLLSIALIMQISHGAYYGFFSLYLADVGFSGWQIGLYWVIGVAAEIVLMWRWTRPLQKVTPSRLFAICLILAAIRWFGIGWSADPLLLALLQLLHAASFAAFHVAAIAWVKRIAPDSRHAAAQGMFSAAGFGLGSTIGMMGAGMIAASFGYGAAFYSCAAVALLGVPLAMLLPGRGVSRA